MWTLEKKLKNIVFLLLLACLSLQLNAAVIWDYSPLTTGGSGNTFTNQSNTTHFGERVTFGNDVFVTGMDIYTGIGKSINNTQSVTIRIWNDDLGQPDVLVENFIELISTVDNLGSTGSEQRVHTDFSSPISLSPGSYWFSMSGNPSTISGIVGDVGDLGMYGLLNNFPDDRDVYAFNNNTAFAFASSFIASPIGDMAFRLEGTVVSSVPVPAAVWLFSLGLIGLIRIRRKPSKVSTLQPNQKIQLTI